MNIMTFMLHVQICPECECSQNPGVYRLNSHLLVDWNLSLWVLNQLQAHPQRYAPINLLIWPLSDLKPQGSANLAPFQAN